MRPDNTTRTLWLIALIVIVTAWATCCSLYQECRAHGFSVFYCLSTR